MGHMKDFDRRIRNGGDDAIAAVAELWEAREKILFDITDAFTKARWIPVGERLPEDGESVLVNHWMTGIEMAFRRDGQWGIIWTGFMGSGSGYTHWMPLPEPPQP